MARSASAAARRRLEWHCFCVDFGVRGAEARFQTSAEATISGAFASRRDQSVMRDVIALVLAGGRIGDYGVLTQNRPKGALTFAGVYRVIDYALSALRQAG